MRAEIWVKPVTYVGRDLPKGATPSDAGLRRKLEYRILDIHDNGDIESEAYFSVVNEKGELYFISNRHFRIVAILDPDTGNEVSMIREPLTY